MTRSPYINLLIERCLATKLEIHVSDGKDIYICTTFKEITDIVDSVDLAELSLHENHAWFVIVLENNGIENNGKEQLDDHSNNTFSRYLTNHKYFN